MALVGLLAARDLLAARRSVTSAQDAIGRLPTSADDLASAERRAAAARQLDLAIASLEAGRAQVAGSVPLRLVSVLPGLGYQRAGLVRLAEDGRDVAKAARSLIATADRLQAAPLEPGQLPLAALATAQSELQRTADELVRVRRGVRGLWGPLADARRRLDDAVTAPQVRAQRAADVIGALRSFAGEEGARQYLVLGANNAEMRDQGAFLSYALVRLERGRLVVERTDPIGAVALSAPAPVPLPAGTTAVFGNLGITRLWQSVNATADADVTGRAALAMFQQSTGRTLDGVVIVDVPALVGILGVTGPVTAGGRTLGVDNAAAFLLRGQYAGLATGSAQLQRREAVSSVVDAVAARLRTTPAPPVALGRALSGAAAGRHLLLWSSRPAEQAVFARAGLGGSPAAAAPGLADRTFHASVQEAGGTKLDAYVSQRLDVRVTVQPNGTAVVRTRILLHNGAPVGAAPSYALGPNTSLTQRPGQYVARTYLWAPAGAEMPDSVSEAGLVLGPEKPLTIEPGQDGEISFETIITNAVRGGRLDLRWVPQPRAVPVSLSVSLTAVGWKVHGEAQRSSELSRSRTLSWGLSKQTADAAK